MNHPALTPNLRPASARQQVAHGPVLETLGVMSAMLGGVLLFGLAATLTGLALLVAGGLAWVSGWWCNYESWCDRCRSIVERE